MGQHYTNIGSASCVCGDSFEIDSLAKRLGAFFIKFIKLRKSICGCILLIKNVAIYTLIVVTNLLSEHNMGSLEK